MEMQQTTTAYGFPPDPDRCPFCHDLGPEAPRDKTHVRLGLSITNLRRARSRSADGCAGCSIVEQALTHLGPDWRDATPWSECEKCNPGAYRLCREGECARSAFAILQLGDTTEICYPFRTLDDLASGPRTTLELFVSEGRAMSREAVQEIIQSEGVASDWTSRLHDTMSWIDHCSAHHYCDGGLAAKTSKTPANIENLAHDDDALPPLGQRAPAQLPHRVLDLRGFTTLRKLNLLESADMIGTYACLSYTWGRNNNYLTTPNTLQAHLDDISFEGLPQTYKDAITVTSMLGIPFLWIDGLCIIQGDTDSADWKEQSSQMASIYGNAVLVIAAANSTSVEDGFLTLAQPARTLLAFSSHTPASSGPGLTVHARPMLDHSWLGWSTLAELKPSGTLSRSWCFQEEVLAARLLTFYGGEMNFQCLGDEHRCECGFPAETLGLVTIKELYEPRLRLSDAETPNWMWQSTVEHYSRRKLAVPKDRLTALSGVARVARAALKTPYVAGHWLDRDFLCSLCWAPVRSREAEERRMKGEYLAPLWSWAAHDGPVTMWIPYGGSKEPMRPRYLGGTAVRGVRMVPAAGDSTGAAAGGTITVRGVFLHVGIEMAGHSAGVMTRNDVRIPFYFDRRTDVVDPADMFFCWVVCRLPLVGRERRETETYCLVVLRAKPENPESACERVGLVY
ncbi:heterokaryon incompatibility protein [Colletotrichum sojae]|uniref:Heterokaryon incompatibility protein n=1 Tax=Colletotrichum sojae TaxID=2175907 RepID=A0A8H6IS48_9PEZI|nr:heterokaryon incompatibility protein [Colletotrichum sojae]